MRLKMGPLLLGRPILGLALGAGSARGWAHVGVVRALEEAGIRPGIVTGTSAGALMGAYYAAGALKEIESISNRINSLRHTLNFLDVRFSRQGVVAGKNLVRLIRDTLPVTRFDQMEIPFGVITTDLISMQEVHVTEGEVIPAIRSSLSIPGFLEPYQRNGLQFVDGAVLNPVPISLARRMGADVVVAVDLSVPLPYSRAENITEVLTRSVDTMLLRIRSINYQVEPADVTILPDLHDYGFMDYHRTREAIDEGYTKTVESLPAIRRLLRGFYLKRNTVRVDSHYMEREAARYAFPHEGEDRSDSLSGKE